MLLEQLVSVPMVLLSIISPTGYVRVKNFASSAEIQISTSPKMGIRDENFLS